MLYQTTALQKACFYLLFFLSPFLLKAQSIGTFNSVQPTSQTEGLVLPTTHTFQKIIQTGTPLSLGGTLGINLDFAGYVPIGGSSTNGYLSISSETFPAECAILSLSFNNTNKLWTVNSGGKVTFPTSDLGFVSNFCSGTVTPKNTIMVCEEIASNGDLNGDGYEDLGWVIEIDPVTRTVINQDGAGGVDKLWALGRAMHENVAIKSDQTVLYWGADMSTTGYLYKFVPTVPGNFSNGSLYVLKTTASLGTGTWELISNSTLADQNNTLSLSTAAGAYNFNRIEDVEIGPDGKIYFAATTDGVIYRLRDLGSTVDQLEVFVASTNYDVDGDGPFTPTPWGVGNDNLAFDGEGNLWVLQDGNRNHIWVVGPSHTASTPDVRLFATTPKGSEPTGITFTPDYKYMFLSIQHPNGTNTAAQTDAAGNSVVFDTHTTIVIARKEALGAVTLPIKLSSLNAALKTDGIEISWKAEGANNGSYFDIERSTDGVHFDKIFKKETNAVNGGSRSYIYTDRTPPAAAIVYYRIKGCENGVQCTYSAIQSVHLPLEKDVVRVYPVPAHKELNIVYTAGGEKAVTLSIIDAAGKLMLREVKQLKTGMNFLQVATEKLINGHYLLSILDGKNKKTFPLLIQH
ncbi:MAG: DUF839 domain-containing protein [Flavisolibacter sp.]|nr:DUF839 domain-containing protein [Flavisolibacter sp.]